MTLLRMDSGHLRAFVSHHLLVEGHRPGQGGSQAPDLLVVLHRAPSPPHPPSEMGSQLGGRGMSACVFTKFIWTFFGLLKFGMAQTGCTSLCGHSFGSLPCLGKPELHPPPSLGQNLCSPRLWWPSPVPHLPPAGPASGPWHMLFGWLTYRYTFTSRYSHGCLL